MIHNFLTLRPVLVIIWTLAVLIALEPCTAALSQVQGDCSARLKEAEKKFEQGDFDASLGIIEGCLKKGSLTRQETARIEELRAQNYTGKAASSARKLLELAPGYDPNPARCSPAFLAEVQNVKREVAGEKLQAGEQPGGGLDVKWVLIGGGVVAAGVIIALVAMGRNSESSAPPLGVLPGPPGLP